jgi:hypothetical protein
MARKTLNFTVHTRLAERWSGWMDHHGVKPGVLFDAMALAFSEMSDDERIEWIRRALTIDLGPTNQGHERNRNRRAG